MPETDHQLAARVAAAAGEELLTVRAGEESGRALGAVGDRRAHQRIVGLLTDARPDDPIRSEEGRDLVPEAGRLWIVDPLDGTREFGELGRTDWAVHIALWESTAGGGRLLAGAVALPALELVLSTDEPPTVPPAVDGAPRLVVSRTRPPDVTEPIRHALDGMLVPMGSAGAKAMAVVRGEADVYAHAGGQYEWDSAAPVAVAAAAGLHVSRLDGTPLVYGRADPWLPDLLICRPELAGDVLAVTA